MATYYISTTGNDNTGNGTINTPWFNLNKAWTVIAAGDTVYVRGGTYNYTAQQLLRNKNGTAGNLIKVWAYADEIPIFTRSGSFASYYNRRALLYFSGNYIHFKNIKITGMTQLNNGVWMGTSFQDFNNCIIERLDTYGCGLGGYWTGNNSNNLILNCDFHDNYDPITGGESGSPYENADGLNYENTTGSGNIIRGCRFWNNADDGLDLYGHDCDNTLVENCWCWGQGFQEDRETLGGDGSGFKLGGLMANPIPSKLAITIRNCIAFGNAAWGYNENASQHIMNVYNNISYANNVLEDWGGGFHFNKNGVAYSIKNNIAFNEIYAEDLGVLTNVDHNTWDLNVTVNTADFVSTVTSQLIAARKADGSLPDITAFHLVEGSDLRGAGVAINGLTLDGEGKLYEDPPCLGPYEFLTEVVPPDPSGTCVLKRWTGATWETLLSFTTL
jgi:hypothetical protein